jgi:hypothetical protein
MTAIVLDNFIPITEGEGGTAPQGWMATTDSPLADVTSSGSIAAYVGTSQEQPFTNFMKINDVVFLNYDVSETSLGTAGQFLVTGTGGGSLELSSNDISLPTVTGDFVNFTNTTGGLGDAGFSPTDATKTKVVMASSVPVVSGNFSTFSATNGTIGDSSYSPTDASKTKVVMASAAVLANHIACFSDTSGTVNDDVATAINAGNIQAGLSGTAGYVASFPAAAATGSLRLQATANTQDAAIIITNEPSDQTITYVLPKTGLTPVYLPIVPNSATLPASFAMYAKRSSTFGGGGTTAVFVDADMDGDYIVTANILTSANSVSITKVIPGDGDFDVEFSADPGAGTVVQYIAFIQLA